MSALDVVGSIIAFAIVLALFWDSEFRIPLTMVGVLGLAVVIANI